MRWQELYETVTLQVGRRLPEPLIRHLAQRALDDLAQRSHLWRARTQLSTTADTLEYALPDRCIEPYVLLRSDGTEVPRVSRHTTLKYRGSLIWHTTQSSSGARVLVIGQVSLSEPPRLVGVEGTFTLEYATYPPQLTGDPAQELPVPAELLSGLESRVLEPFMAGNPELLRFHHARWRDAVALAQQMRNRLTTASSIQTHLPEL